MIGQEDGMFMFLSKKIKRKQATPLNEAQRALVEKKFEILRQASFGFTHDRLLHIQEEDLKGWTDACTGELRRKITLAAPSHIKIALIDFRKLRCVSLQCLPLRMHADGARLADGLGPAPAPWISKEGGVEVEGDRTGVGMGRGTGGGRQGILKGWLRRMDPRDSDEAG